MPQWNGTRIVSYKYFENEVMELITIIRRRTFIKRHKSRNIHSEALYMSKYTCVVEL